MNVSNLRRGVEARRDDGTFGQLIPGERSIIDPGYSVARGPIATVEIGVEVKILAKAMIKQMDRVINVLILLKIPRALRNKATFHASGLGALPRPVLSRLSRTFAPDCTLAPRV